MLGFGRRNQPEVIKYDNWTFENFEFSPSEFYASIENEMAAHEMPGLFVERIEHKEGGILSAKREYLRIRRERLVFDVCLAPFGTFWFLSRRYSLIPFSLRGWQVLAVVFVLLSAHGAYVSLFGSFLGSILFGSTLLGLALLIRNAVALGLHDLDGALLRVPLVGELYEFWFRKDTYYREDTRSAYITIVDAIISARVDELKSQEGIKLVRYADSTPPSHPAVMSMIGELLRVSR